VLGRSGLRILDIGAGYGRLAWRTTQAVPEVADYCCVDAVPESTFLCEYYLRHRGVAPPARVVPYDQLDAQLAGARFDIVFNVHSFSECTYGAVQAWFERVQALKIPYLFLVPNEAEGFLSKETDDRRLDLMPLVTGAGYELARREPVYEDPAVRQLLGIDDHYHLFRLRGS
jgi:SAM-dependent methyltransferase